MNTYMLLVLTALFCFSSSTIKCAEANELKLRAREKMRKDKAERQLQANNAGLVFSRGYVCITRQQDFAFVIPQQRSIVLERGELFDLNLLGSSTIQSGGIYDPADVQIIDRLGTSEADNFIIPRGRGAKLNEQRGQFAGQRQPKFIPQKDPGFFFNGECVATQVAGPQILGHSCLLNLCLGGGGYNCLAIYAGSKFVFNPLEQVLFSPSTFIFVDNNSDKNEVLGTVVPSLPPSYPGTIIGGTGLFVGAVGYVDVTTITGSTLTPARDRNVDNRRSGKDKRDAGILSNLPQAGYITQKINVVTNVPLPVAP
ncbi:hypothetical protein FRACYDRAFT_244947 [Fragilariopsis cylindrus CCMP1102]|uniref:Altered inheritance of mitochondria protein 24, mitochondrial n=1 Tax=Fragilariopsis cylindrus CCMP1102 TaxID=635003 RepID=A0A1E7F0T4_9STRA|nr:hypothetical protein FRACYDRAFT_244947 [Fragilariopsis cylindrus CCMP1102]|eukprot:OEU11828.1 hypothetical protein FRACYDRAFT_244947 [Fragilariopsis cylindrus CCMP1102]